MTIALIITGVIVITLLITVYVCATATVRIRTRQVFLSEVHGEGDEERAGK